MDSYVRTKKWENCAEFFNTKCAVQENCAKIVCCGKNCADSYICQNWAAQLRYILVGLIIVFLDLTELKCAKLTVYFITFTYDVCKFDDWKNAW